MIKRISSIMDMRRKRTGVFIACIITLSIIATSGVLAVQAQSNDSPLPQVANLAPVTNVVHSEENHNSTTEVREYHVAGLDYFFSQFGSWSPNADYLWLTWPWQMQHPNPPGFTEFNGELELFWEAMRLYLERYNLVITSDTDGLHFQLVSGDDFQPSLVTHSEVESSVGGDCTQIWFSPEGNIVKNGVFYNYSSWSGYAQFISSGETITIPYSIFVEDGYAYIPFKYFEDVLDADNFN